MKKGEIENHRVSVKEGEQLSDLKRPHGLTGDCK